MINYFSISVSIYTSADTFLIVGVGPRVCVPAPARLHTHPTKSIHGHLIQ